MHKNPRAIRKNPCSLQQEIQSEKQRSRRLTLKNRPFRHTRFVEQEDRQVSEHRQLAGLMTHVTSLSWLLLKSIRSRCLDGLIRDIGEDGPFTSSMSLSTPACLADLMASVPSQRGLALRANICNFSESSQSWPGGLSWTAIGRATRWLDDVILSHSGIY